MAEFRSKRRWRFAVAFLLYGVAALALFAWTQNIVTWVLVAPGILYGLYEAGREIVRLARGLARFTKRNFAKPS
jgi:hypothetical protein